MSSSVLNLWLQQFTSAGSIQENVVRMSSGETNCAACFSQKEGRWGSTKGSRIPKGEDVGRNESQSVFSPGKLNRTRDLQLKDVSQVVGRTSKDTPAFFCTSTSLWTHLCSKPLVFSHVWLFCTLSIIVDIFIEVFILWHGTTWIFLFLLLFGFPCFLFSSSRPFLDPLPFWAYLPFLPEDLEENNYFLVVFLPSAEWARKSRRPGTKALRAKSKCFAALILCVVVNMPVRRTCVSSLLGNNLGALQSATACDCVCDFLCSDRSGEQLLKATI